MNRLLLLLCLLLPWPVHAAWDCLPSVPLPASIAFHDSARITPSPAGAVTPGRVVSWWCYVPDPATNTAKWQANHFVVLDKNVDLAKWGMVSARVLAAPDVVAAANTEMLAAQVIPAAGSIDEYETKRLFYLGCLRLVAEPPEVLNPVLTPAFCGAEPAPPAATTTVYVVSVTQAFPLKADGTRSITLWPQPAIVGEPADGNVKILQFGATFCRVPRLSTATTTVVAGCRIKP